MSTADTTALIEGVLDGETVAIARTLSMIEDRQDGFRTVLKRLYPESGSASIIGLTGPPGSGKSSLVDSLVPTYTREQKRVGVVAVDPASPFSGGAVLGDRVRFRARSADEDVFFRSMSARGTSGGLAATTNEAIRVLDAGGYDPILVETVGAGQNEIDVIRTADTVLVVTMPSTGDEIQMLKAGILEIGEIFVVNKMDLEGADRTYMDLREMIQMGNHPPDPTASTEPDWEIPVVQTEARNEQNIDSLRSKINEHQVYLESSGRLKDKRANRRQSELRRILQEEISRRTKKLLEEEGGIEGLSQRVEDGDKDPYTVTEELLERLK